MWNRTPGRAAELTGRGATAAADPAAAAAGRDAVLLSLADDRAVLAVAGEGGGLADALGAAVLVDTSTVSPATSRRLAAAVGRDQMVAAPIMGPPAAVAGGAATYLLGGPEATVARLEPLWESLSSSHRWCGEDPGTATTFKVLGNYPLMSGLAALSEVVAVAQAAGLGDPALREFLGQSPLVAPALQNRLDDMVDGDHRGWFAARLGAKDVALFEEARRRRPVCGPGWPRRCGAAMRPSTASGSPTPTSRRWSSSPRPEATGPRVRRARRRAQAASRAVASTAPDEDTTRANATWAAGTGSGASQAP